MLLQVIILILSSIVAIVAIRGNTWNQNGNSIFTRITMMGWITICCLILSLGLSIVKHSIDSRQLFESQIKYKNNIQEIKAKLAESQSNENVAILKLDSLKCESDSLKDAQKRSLQNEKEAIDKLHTLYVEQNIIDSQIKDLKYVTDVLTHPIYPFEINIKIDIKLYPTVGQILSGNEPEVNKQNLKVSLYFLDPYNESVKSHLIEYTSFYSFEFKQNSFAWPSLREYCDMYAVFSQKNSYLEDSVINQSISIDANKESDVYTVSISDENVRFGTKYNRYSHLKDLHDKFLVISVEPPYYNGIFSINEIEFGFPYRKKKQISGWDEEYFKLQIGYEGKYIRYYCTPIHEIILDYKARSHLF